MKHFIDKKTSNNIFYVLGILFILVLWFLGFNIFDNDYIIPGIKDTFISLFELFKTPHTYTVLFNTLLRLVISISICFIMGVIFGSLSKISSKFKAFVKPLFTLLKTAPLMVLIILLLVVFNRNSLYFIVGFVVMPIIYEATINGLDSIDKNITEQIKLESNLTPYVIGKIYLPLTTPYIITSLLQSFGLGLKVLVMAEFISNADNSIGNEIIFYKDIANEMSYVYAWSIILVSLVLVIDILINFIKKSFA